MGYSAYNSWRQLSVHLERMQDAEIKLIRMGFIDAASGVRWSCILLETAISDLVKRLPSKYQFQSEQHFDPHYPYREEEITHQ